MTWVRFFGLSIALLALAVVAAAGGELQLAGLCALLAIIAATVRVLS